MIIRPFRRLLSSFPKSLFSTQPNTQNQDITAVKKEIKFDEASALMVEKLKKMKNRFIGTSDDYRVDGGLIIERSPIFLNLNDQEIEYLKLRTKMEKKLKLRVDFPKELTNFELKYRGENIADKLEENFKTHYDPATETHYCSNSKLFKNVDPAIDDPTSIQNAPNYRVYLLVKDKLTGNWEFPTFNLLEQEKFKAARENFFDSFSKKQWRVHFYSEIPYVVKKRELYPHESKDARNKKFKGVKSFYFGARHMEGIAKIVNENWSECAWVPRLQMNKFLTREDYDTFIHSLFLF